MCDHEVDSILRRVRRAKELCAARHGYDVGRMGRAANALALELGFKLVLLNPHDTPLEPRPEDFERAKRIADRLRRNAALKGMNGPGDRGLSLDQSSASCASRFVLENCEMRVPLMTPSPRSTAFATCSQVTATAGCGAHGVRFRGSAHPLTSSSHEE